MRRRTDHPESALDTGSAQFQILAEVSPGGIFLADGGGKLTYVSPRAREMTGTSDARIMGRSWTELVSAPGRAAALEHWREAMDAGRFWTEELRCDQERIAVFRIGVYADRGFIGTVEDVTQQRRAEERTESFIGTAAELIGTVDLKTLRFTSINPAFERVLGFSAEEFLASPEAEIHPDDGGEFRANLLRRGQPVFSEVRHRSRDGTYRIISWSAYPVVEQGTAFAIGRDVTRHRQLEEERRRLAALVEHSGDMIEMATMEGEILYINPAGLELVGWKSIPEHATLGDLLPAEKRERYLASIRARQLLESGWEGELDFFNHRTGGVIPVHMKAFGIHRNGPNFVGRAFIARDMRRWRRAEAALRQSDRLANMGRVAATIAHEINNPLAAAVNLAYLLYMEPSLGSHPKKLAEQLQTELARVGAVTRQTLGYFRNTGELTWVPVSEIVQSVVGVFAPRATAWRIRFETQLDPAAKVMGSANELRQVMLNLVGNALDSMVETGGRVCLRVTQAHSLAGGRSRAGVRITVIDSGRGIPAAVRRRIFEPFFTTKSTGTGLGLWVTAEIVAKHQGDIRVRNMPGGGTCFRIFLPKDRDPDAELTRSQEFELLD